MAAGTEVPDTGWMLDELASAGRENLDAGHVARYDAKEAWDAAAEVDRLVELGLDSRSTIVDLGTGTGRFALAAAPRCSRVVAVDISPLMLERLEAKVTAAGVTNVECVQAGFLSYVHEGPLADFVFSRWALHHLPDFWKALALERVRQLLRPGGVLRLLDIVFSFDPRHATQRIDEWCRTLPRAPATEDSWMRADIEEHVRDEHSTFTWILEPMIGRCGFRIDQVDRSDDGIFAEYVARAI